MEDLIKIITMVAIGVTATNVYPEVAKKVTPILKEAIQHQENTVRVAEYLELDCSIPARAEWDKNKQVALSRLESFNNLANQTSDTDSESGNQ